MTDSIIRGKVIFRRLLDHLCNNLIYRILRSVGHKDRTRLCAGGLHMPGPFHLFVGSGQFVFLDPAGFIFGNADSGDDAILPVINHLLTVNIKTGFPILNQNAIRYQPA